MIEKSGSCAIAALIIEEYCYVANLGDSRAIVSKHRGKVIQAITLDHKPSMEAEQQRIIAKGGKIY